MQARQKEILKVTIIEYIRGAQPVASQFLAENYPWQISPATIRSELAALEKAGYLYHPYTSAGRVPTDKGYRYFVDHLIDRQESYLQQKRFLEKRLRQRSIIRVIQEATSFLASETGNVVFAGDIHCRMIYQAGLRRTLEAPEFASREVVLRLLEALHQLKMNVSNLFEGTSSELELFIGRECPYLRNFSDFSIILARWQRFSQKGLLALLGPKRMWYEKNLALMDHIRQLIS